MSEHWDGFYEEPIDIKKVKFYAPGIEEKDKLVHKANLWCRDDVWNYKIFYLPYSNTDKDGFVFCVTEFHSGDDCTLDYKVDVIMQGWGFFDGIRHVDTAYMNYPDMLALVEVYKELHNLQLKYCSEGRWFCRYE